MGQVWSVALEERVTSKIFPFGKGNEKERLIYINTDCFAYIKNSSIALPQDQVQIWKNVLSVI